MQCSTVSRSNTAMLHAPARPAARVASGGKLAPVVVSSRRHPAPIRSIASPPRAANVRAAMEGAQPQVAKAPPAVMASEQEQRPVWQGLLQRLARYAGMVALGFALFFGAAGAAHAARSGGRVGGSSFSRSSFGGGSGFSSGRGSGAAVSGLASSWGGSSSRSSSAWSSQPFSGGFRSASPTSSFSTGSVRTNSFFLSPFGEPPSAGLCGVGAAVAAACRHAGISVLEHTMLRVTATACGHPPPHGVCHARTGSSWRH